MGGVCSSSGTSVVEKQAEVSGGNRQRTNSNMATALIVVDVQNDFCTDGALEVPGGEEIVPAINRLREAEVFDHIVLSQDWHPLNHRSFASNNEQASPFDTLIDDQGRENILWPNHCVQESVGAEFHPVLLTHPSDTVIRKGTNPAVDSYSAFFDNHKQQQTDLHHLLQKMHVHRVYVCGLATDYCVMYTALDAKELGYDTFVIEDACRGLKKDSTRAAFEKMSSAGIKTVTSQSFLS